MRYAAKPRLETDGAFAALFATYAAFNLVLRQAFVPDAGQELPCRAVGMLQKGLRCACRNAVGTEGALAQCKIDCWVTAISLLDDAGWAGAGTVATTGAGGSKVSFRDCPRRT